MNELNVARSLTRRILIDGQVLLVGEQPVSSLPPGDPPACRRTAVG